MPVRTGLQLGRVRGAPHGACTGRPLTAPTPVSRLSAGCGPGAFAAILPASSAGPCAKPGGAPPGPCGEFASPATTVSPSRFPNSLGGIRRRSTCRQRRPGRAPAGPDRNGPCEPSEHYRKLAALGAPHGACTGRPLTVPTPAPRLSAQGATKGGTMKLKIAAGIWALSVLVALIISAVVGGRWRRVPGHFGGHGR